MINQRILIQVIASIDYKPDTQFVYGRLGDGWYIQHQQLIPDCMEAESTPQWQKGRKFYISKHMCVSEIIQTALMAAIAFEEHEARECFRVNGNSIYGPHIDWKFLSMVSDQKETRDETGYKPEPSSLAIEHATV